MESYKKIVGGIDLMQKNHENWHRVICLALIIILLISLIPVFIVAGYDCASGDDYNYGAGAHLAYLATGSVFAAIKAAVDTTIRTWYGWQGTWFDCFVFCLHPEVFSDTAYVIVPYIFVILQIICFTLFAYHFFKTRWKLGKYLWFEVALVFLIFSFQLVPSQKSAIFWWVGSVHYAMPMCMTLIGIVLADRYLLEHRTKDLIGLIIIATLLGGVTYPAIILTTLSIFLLWLSKAVISKNRDKKDLLLLIPFVLEMIGFIVSVIAPGNAVRSASDIKNGAQPSGGAVATIIKSIIFSVQDALGFFIAEKTFVIIALILIGIMTYYAVADLIKSEEIEISNRLRTFSHPVLFAVTLFLLNASVYAPRLYAGGEVSSGYFNFNFWTFFMCMTALAVYLVSYVTLRYADSISHNKKYVKGVVIMSLACVMLIIAYVGRHGVKSYTDYVCLEYYLSGQADDYKEQMKLQRMLMSEEGVDDVIVPEVNNEQGPLMQMPVVADPDNVDNYMTASFYGKNSCIAIPRQEWIKKFGERYGIE